MHLTRKHNWNYSCAERYGYGESQDFGDLPLHIKFDSNNIATITGEINETFAEELERSLSRREAPELKAIKINSYGGYVYSAMEAGQFIRERNLATFIGKTCMSACPLVVAGGRPNGGRNVTNNNSVIGFHKVAVEGKALPNDHEIYSDIKVYLDIMGVNSLQYIKYSLSAEPQDMTIGPAEACDIGLVNSGCQYLFWREESAINKICPEACYAYLLSFMQNRTTQELSLKTTPLEKSSSQLDPTYSKS